MGKTYRRSSDYGDSRKKKSKERKSYGMGGHRKDKRTEVLNSLRYVEDKEEK